MDIGHNRIGLFELTHIIYPHVYLVLFYYLYTRKSKNIKDTTMSYTEYSW
jgi:hypothetical protein